MYWEINVSLNGKHFFATHKRSCTNTSETKKVLKEILKKFTKEEGYAVSLSYREEGGRSLQDLQDAIHSDDAIDKYVKQVSR